MCAPAGVIDLNSDFGAIRDGVNSPLANLFVHVAVNPLLTKVECPEPPLSPLLSKEGRLHTPLLAKEGTGVVVPPPNTEGAIRARSATEAFLYRRLETLAETAGRFRLNAELPIPFDGWGRMEVDLLCAKSRIAVELDGGQHLGNTDAYRRDRRKDALLQENGYLVLRFLAEDVGKYLDQVLDAILRALSHQDART